MAELIVTSEPGAELVPTVIDADEFEQAHDDPVWRAFCEDADRYVSGFSSLGGNSTRP
jgi:hypothetical protein